MSTYRARKEQSADRAKEEALEERAADFSILLVKLRNNSNRWLKRRDSMLENTMIVEKNEGEGPVVTALDIRKELAQARFKRDHTAGPKIFIRLYSEALQELKEGKTEKMIELFSLAERVKALTQGQTEDNELQQQKDYLIPIFAFIDAENLERWRLKLEKYGLLQVAGDKPELAGLLH